MRKQHDLNTLKVSIEASEIRKTLDILMSMLKQYERMNVYPKLGYLAASEFSPIYRSILELEIQLELLIERSVEWEFFE